MLSLSCECTHFLGLAAPLHAPLTRRRWDRGRGGEKSGLFLAKSSALSLKSSPFSLARRVVFFSLIVSFALAHCVVFSRRLCRLLSSVASFFLADCVVCSRPSHSCVGYRPRRRHRSVVPSRARYAYSASFRFSAFTARLFAFNRLIVRWLRVKDSPRKRVLNIFVIVCCTVYCG